MNDNDTYYNIAKAGEGQYREKMSRFLAFAYKVKQESEAREIINRVQNEYHDARHVCWAYRLGPKGEVWQINDNGEPSGTAGKPILGQMLSADVTDVVICVVRYFGGIKLGTSGLIQAYREAASLALADAGRQECHSMGELDVAVGYERVDKALKIVTVDGVEITERQFDNLCRLKLLVRLSMMDEIKGRLRRVDGIEIKEF